MGNFNWTCPYCGRATTIVDSNQKISSVDFDIQNVHGDLRLKNHFIVCPNEECKKLTLLAELFTTEWTANWETKLTKDTVNSWNLMPDSFAKQYPEYIPMVIIKDYEEACKIRDLSPKASATLSRRCLQGMIRDFWGIKKGRLVDEINAIEDKVDPIVWKSIDSVRKIGNIGAHMEKDINLIIEVEPNEAQILIELIEMLIEEWYIHRYERELKMNSLIEMSKSKGEQKNIKNTTQQKI
eukprot:TRINITY_DN1253_c0_g1_i7.p2 TRINITY_DN1253_c0_g1~~TRINITY_DN1253_c0_g1_i7.p2  ORF type:complete len:239 (-),score=38.14 TRINITY_DN1253_c0_g1_i7:2002-2718(-)